MNLNNKVAVVTGAARGIGKAIAMKLAENGADIIGLDLDITQNDQVLREVQALGRQAVGIDMDLTDLASIPTRVQQIIDSHKKIDILVNNAGIYPATSLLEITPEEWEKVYRLNVHSLFFLSQSVAKYSMVTQKGGVIINIASCDGKLPSRGIAHYASSKAAVISITKSLCIELSEYGIRTNCVAPGWVATDTVLKSDRWKMALPGIPSGRLANMEEIGDAVAYLASDSSSYINGETLDVNGGCYLD